MKRKKSFAIIAALFFVLLSGWTAWAQPGKLQFFANGEELITEGFVAPKLTKDGWELTFDHAFVTLSGITAYVTDPPYDPHSGEAISGKSTARLEGVHTVDLARGDPTILVGEVSGVEPGHYNAISWDMVKASQGELAGYSMVLIGTARKGERQIPFQIKSTDEYGYRCGEFVGDERKGFVAEGGVGDLEMTFHFDHIFGRADKAADDPLNLEAVGFDPFAEKAPAVHVLDLKGMHLGHAGEGHCNVLWP